MAGNTTIGAFFPLFLFILNDLLFQSILTYALPVMWLYCILFITVSVCMVNCKPITYLNFENVVCSFKNNFKSGTQRKNKNSMYV